MNQLNNAETRKLLNNADTRKLHMLRVITVSLILMLISIGTFSYGEVDESGTLPPRALASLLLLVAFNAIHAWSYYAEWIDSRPQYAAAFWLLLLVTVGLHFTMQDLGMAGTFSAFCIARVPVRYGFRAGLYLIAMAVPFYLATLYLRGWNEEGLYWILFAVPFFLFVLVISHTFARERFLRRRTDELVSELRSTQTLLAHVSRQRERLRISRDLHDLLGHHMTALILNLEVAGHKATPENRSHVDQALALARLLLVDLRSAVSELRDSVAPDLREALQRLVAAVPQLNVVVEIEEGLELRDATVSETLLRCIQESLTNTLRHARATHCVIRLHRADDTVTLDICDNGVLKGEPVPGNGLKGMVERVVALSGKLEWNNRDGSFALRAVLPMEPLLP
jgi:two-component system sensor histidine kinase DesK